MGTLVIGLDCAAPEILLRDERLRNLRQLMARGCHGRLESVIPPITVPAWSSMMTGKNPGRLGFYGFRNRKDHSYEGMNFANSTSVCEPTVWDILSKAGKKVAEIK